MDRLTYTLEDQALMSQARNYFDWQARVIVPELGKRVVEIGCGTGNFTRTLLDRDQVIAVDIEAACVARLTARFPARKNLHTFVGGPDDPGFAALARFEPDSCVCLNVLEHIEDDTAALEQMSRILVPGGIVVLLVPAFPSLYGPVDRNLGHYRRYTRSGLRSTAHRAGLKLRKDWFMNLPGFFGWWMNARVLRREVQSSSQIRAFDRFVVPAASRIERLVSPPFGQSLIAVLQKL